MAGSGLSTLGKDNNHIYDNNKIFPKQLILFSRGRFLVLSAIPWIRIRRICSFLRPSAGIPFDLEGVEWTETKVEL